MSLAMLRFRCKRILRNTLSHSGLARLRWRLLPGGLYCFTFHRIGDAASCPFDRGTFSCSTEQFEHIVRLLNANFEVISLKQLQEWDSQRVTSRRPLAILTFDDAYHDNYQQAFPVLRRHGLSAVFFLPTAFIGQTAIPWWDEIAWCVRNATVSEIVLPGTAGKLQLHNGDIETAIRSVLRVIYSRRDAPIEETTDEIRRLTQSPPPPKVLPEAPCFMSWSDVRTLVEGGMDIGSHTHNHNILAGLSADEQEHELVFSKRLIESNIGAEVMAVSYPVGNEMSFDDKTAHFAKKAGYSFGFSFITGTASLPLTNPFAIPRYNVNGSRPSETMILRVGFPRLKF